MIEVTLIAIAYLTPILILGAFINGLLQRSEYHPRNAQPPTMVRRVE